MTKATYFTSKSISSSSFSFSFSFNINVCNDLWLFSGKKGINIGTEINGLGNEVSECGEAIVVFSHGAMAAFRDSRQTRWRKVGETKDLATGVWRSFAERGWIESVSSIEMTRVEGKALSRFLGF